MSLWWWFIHTIRQAAMIIKHGVHVHRRLFVIDVVAN
jgi:hypothetical protein